MDISELDLGQSVKVKDVEVGEFEVLTPGRITIATVEVPRAMRGKASENEEETEEVSEE